ncbi:hypothetical protein CA85_24210 [Allorhodopirellula solitaria]|uniref:Uncharacterized protein n=1 Tax=Allorhodopirellula solitaria TaxID=2527987 RepID=A0A5C5XYH1_9BACT|nr:hypothetical protein CA85_24210 [Allorhodopirellula solitaria]
MHLPGQTPLIDLLFFRILGLLAKNTVISLSFTQYLVVAGRQVCRTDWSMAVQFTEFFCQNERASQRETDSSSVGTPFRHP